MSQNNSSQNAKSIQERLKTIGKADFFHVLAEVPDLCNPFMDIAINLWNFRDDRTREIIVLRLASSFGSSYELQHHLTIARQAGLSMYEIEAIIQGRMLENFKEHENCLLTAVDQIINKESVDKESFFKYYNKEELQYLVAFAGFYSWLNYYTTALDLKVGQKTW